MVENQSLDISLKDVMLQRQPTSSKEQLMLRLSQSRLPSSLKEPNTSSEYSLSIALDRVNQLNLQSQSLPKYLSTHQVLQQNSEQMKSPRHQPPFDGNHQRLMVDHQLLDTMWRGAPMASG